MYSQSKLFFSNFSKIFNDQSSLRQEAVKSYAKNSEFTVFITNQINNIIEVMGYEHQNEYYRIDALGYTSQKNKLDIMKGFKAQCWDLKIAVEHENDPEEWLDEVIKLAHICCPLRVIIGYVPMHLREKGDSIRLEYAANALKRLDCSDNVVHGEFMVILGNCDTKGEEQNFFNYKAYVLNRETFAFENLEKYI